MTQQQDPAGMAGVMETLSAASRQMGDPAASSEADTVSLIVSAAAGTVPGAEQAGVTLLATDGAIISQAVSDQAVSAIDQLQATYREGPCVTALWDEHTVAVDDVAAEANRWPRFGTARCRPTPTA